MLVKRFPKNIIVIAIACCTSLYSCKDKLELPDQPVDSYTRVYMPSAADGTVVKVLKITDDVQSAVYGAAYGGLGYPNNDIPVTFTVNPAEVDNFNAANKTAYAILPEGSYTLSGLNATILQGSLSTAPLTLSFKTKGDGAMRVLKTYVLPVSIANTSVKVNEALRTTYYVVTAQPDFNNYPNYNRAEWTILNFSSQEATGEGANNGRAIFALDGSTDTYWHTQYRGAAPLPPHYLTIDMGTTKTLHGLSFVGRQSTGAGKPNEVNVRISLDNVTWTDAGTFNLQNVQTIQKVFLPEGFQNARYFKVTVNSSFSNTYTQIAELNAF